MRKLKLQMQLSLDGFVCRPDGALDWMTWDWDQGLKDFTQALTETVDTILLGRKMTDDFVNHWEVIVNKGQADSGDRSDIDFFFAQRMVGYRKFIFSKTIHSHPGKNTTVVNGPLADEVNRIKSASGKDIIVYGGAGFVSSLVDSNLIDEYYLFINPTAIGAGKRIFASDKKMELVTSRRFESGIIVNCYKPF